MQIDFANLKYQYKLYKSEIDTAIHNVLDKSNYIMGEEVTRLEKNLEEFTGSKHAITCSSGTDALLLAMMALDIKPGDEIITSDFSFVACIEVIALLKLNPVLVDVDLETFNIDCNKVIKAITPNTKAIIPVHLFGQSCRMEEILEIANKNNLQVIEDNAQALGSTYKFSNSKSKCLEQ